MENFIKNGKTLSLLAFIFIIIFTACSDALKEDPTNFVSPQNFYRSGDDAKAALNGAYKELTAGRFRAYFGGYKMARLLLEPTPEGRNGKNTPTQTIMENWRWTPSQTVRSSLPDFYKIAYININADNAVINNVPKIKDIDHTLQKRYVAEARFLRALNYYMLVGAFGGVPIKRKQTSSLTGLQKARAPEDSVYKFIISDLKQAIQILPVVSKYDASNQNRASKGAAQTLLARVYLQRGSLNASNGITGKRQIAQPGDYKRAVEEAQKVIDSDEYTLPGDLVKQYRDLFIQESSSSRNPEVIFAIVLDPSAGVNNDGGLPCLTLSENAGKSLAPNSWNQTTSELPFYQSFSDADLRKKMTFLTEYKDGAGKKVTFDANNLSDDNYPEDSPSWRKYSRVAAEAGCGDDNDYVIFRYAGLLLMKAEGLNEANHGPTSEAYSTINQVRERAGLKPLPPGMNYIEFREAVYTERRKELVYEGSYGWYTIQRFWDIAKRRIQEHAKFDARYPPDRQVGPDLDRLDIDEPMDRVFPIPASALARNPNLKQNPGY